jgi:hypothetical protein
MVRREVATLRGVSSQVLERGWWPRPSECITRARGERALSGLQKALLVKLMHNMLPTSCNLNAWGYAVNTSCNVCGDDTEDTLRHRLFRCPAGDAGRCTWRGHADYTGRSDCELKGWVPPPDIDDVWPARVAAREVDTFQLEYTVDGRPSDEFELSPLADVYGDGSALHPSEPTLATAAFALVQQRDDRLYCITAALPLWLPQSAAWAERAACCFARLCLPREEPFSGQYIGDCTSALSLFADPAGRDSDPKAMGGAGAGNRWSLACGRSP